jgi:hypothetical protein
MSTSNIGNVNPPTFHHGGNEQAHVVQFYTQDSFLLDGLCEFVRSALMEGDSTVLVVSKEHRHGLMERLLGCGADVSGAIATGRCVVLDASEALAKFMDGDVPNPRKFNSVIGSVIERAQSAAGGRQVAVFGEMVALLWAEKKFNAALELEQLWNELARTHSFYLRCAYPASGFQGEHNSEPYGEPYASVCARHSAVIHCA